MINNDSMIASNQANLTGYSNEIEPHPSVNKGVRVGVRESHKLYNNFQDSIYNEYLKNRNNYDSIIEAIFSKPFKIFL